MISFSCLFCASSLIIIVNATQGCEEGLVRGSLGKGGGLGIFYSII